MPFFGIDTFSLLMTAFWVWMLIDCLFNRRMRNGGKLFWVLFILFTQIFGAACYFFMKCSMRNPFDAFPYYLRTLKGAFQSWGSPTQSSYYSPRSGPQPQRPQQPRQPQSPTFYPYTDYTQGYQAQSTPHSTRPAPSSSSEQSAAFQPYQPHPAEPEYEQTMASYPEMELPPQQ